MSGLFPSGRLRSVELLRVCVPLRSPIESAHGVEHDRWSILVRVIGVDGAEGWGECPALVAPTYSAEWHEGAWSVLVSHLAPSVLAGRASGVRGHPMATSAIEGALVDLELRRRGVSLGSAIGAERSSVPVCGVVPLVATVDDTLRSVEVLVAAGIRSVKLKIRPGWDIEPVRAVRQAWPALGLAVDANGSYDRNQATEQLAALDALGLTYLEQPLAPDDLVGTAALAAALATPVALDEAATSVGALESAVALGAVEAVSLKPSRLGGFVASLDAHSFLADHGIAMWCGGMFELGVGRAGALAIAGLPGCVLASDLTPPTGYLTRDVVDPFELAVDGTVAVPDGPGIGRAPDPGLLDDVVVARRTIGA